MHPGHKLTGPEEEGGGGEEEEALLWQCNITGDNKMHLGLQVKCSILELYSN